MLAKSEQVAYTVKSLQVEQAHALQWLRHNASGPWASLDVLLPQCTDGEEELCAIAYAVNMGGTRVALRWHAFFMGKHFDWNITQFQVANS